MKTKLVAMAYDFDEYGIDERLKEEEQRRKKRRVYSTAMIEKLIKDKNEGYEIPYDAFYNRELDLRAKGVTFDMTPEEIEEFQKCYDDPVYYVSKYCKFETDYGVKTVKLRDYQEDVISKVTSDRYDEETDLYLPDNRNIIWMASRQTAKTTTISAFFSWMLCFRNDRHILVAANKEDTAKEIVRKIKSVFRGLPYFLKPGCDKFGETGITLENGSLLMSTATTNTASIGFTIHCILLDEFAHIPENIVDNFWRSVYPTLSSSRISQCIITSTPNGTTNKFYDLWSKAITGKNSFLPIRTDYWQVPGHDEAWAEKQRIDFGDEEFAQEFELQFNVSARMLAKATDCKVMDHIAVEYVNKRIISDNELLNDKDIKWHPEFDPNDISDRDYFIMLVDLAEGLGEDGRKFKNKNKEPDFNTINIFKIRMNSIANMKRYGKESMKIEDTIRFVQVGKYSSNVNDEEYAGKVCSALCFDLFEAHTRNNVRVAIEMNFNGKSFTKSMELNDKFEDFVIQKTFHTKPIPGEVKRRKKGFKTSGDKEFFCIKGAKMLGKGRTIVTDRETMTQIQSFGYVKGKIKGIACHDDLSMPVFNHIPRMIKDETFVEWIEDCVEMMSSAWMISRINEMTETWEETNEEVGDDEFRMMYGNIDGVSIPEYQAYSNSPVLNPYSENSAYSAWR